MAIVDGHGHGRAYAYCYRDEAEGTDSSLYGTYSNRVATSSTYSDPTSNSWYLINDSLGCIAPGTVVRPTEPGLVRLTDPGHIIPVAQWDDVERVDAIRFQTFAPRQTATEARTAHETALNRAQMAMEQQAVGLIRRDHSQRVELRRAMGLREGESMSLHAEVFQRTQAVAQQQVVLTQRDLERELREFLVREPGPPPDPEYQQVPQHPEYHPQDPVPSSVTYSDDYLAQEKKREEAEERAQELLSYLIGKEQVEVYKRTNNLFVKGKKYSYIIQKGGYILQLKKNKVIQLCVHLERRHAMPLTDNVIAMKLRIENGENEVLELANEWGEHHRRMFPLPACAGMV